MASSVFYKFKSQRDESRVTFDGTGISLFDLKKEIIIANNLGKANDFDLAIFDRSSNEEYRDDSIVVPRASSVIVKRVFVRPGKGKAAMYLSGSGSSTSGGTDQATNRSAAGPSGSYSWHRGHMSKRFDGKDEASNTAPKPSAPAIKSNVTAGDEAAAMAAMFQASAANWEETQEKMSHQTPIYNNSRGGAPGRGRGAAPHRQPDRPLPPSYVCYRCGQKGHWIQDCPTNNDRDYDNRPRIKRTTGIPRSFLKAVESPNTGPIGAGVMVTPEGGYVVAQPDVASWHKQVKQVTRPKNLSEADIRERKPTDTSLICTIDNKLLKDPVKTPCCGTVYCEECIQTHLLERDFVCPSCSAKIQSLDKLIPEKAMRAKVGEYIEREIEKGGVVAGADGAKNEEEGNTSVPGPSKPEEKQPETPIEPIPSDDTFYTEHQPGANADMDALHMAADSIPAIQAQINQVSVMLNNPTLPMPCPSTDRNEARATANGVATGPNGFCVNPGRDCCCDERDEHEQHEQHEWYEYARTGRSWNVWSRWWDGRRRSGYDGRTRTDARTSRTVGNQSILKSATCWTRLSVSKTTLEQPEKKFEARTTIGLPGGGW
ncbi:hypothetical protein QCA50_009116 [Cerrena zonata]|uniref:DWNN-domain-containing protein n=1 Tax=Cerrena zonata TaxID=2478898 RepID=A0AAW0GD89_9APHY